MLKINDANNFRRTVAGLSLIAAPLVLGASLLIHPGEGEAGLVASIAEHPGLVEAASLLIILSTVLFVPALMGILNLVRVRGVTLVHIGVALMLIGVIGHTVWTTSQIVMVGLIQGGLDQSQLAAAVEGEGPIPVGLITGLIMFLGGFFLGVIVLALGLWRSRAIPKWIPVLMILSSFTDFLPGGRPVMLLGAAIGVITFGAIGLKLLTMSDADWERGTAPSAETVNVGNAEPRVQ